MPEKYVKVGQKNRLKVVDKAGFGVFMEGKQFDEILLPKRHVPEDCEIGNELDVFVYLDSDDHLIATTETPLASVGEFAFLKVKEVNPVGAFLDWNLGKDLLVPFKEQKVRMREGGNYVVYLYQDEQSRRIVASSRLHRFIDETPGKYRQGESVSLLIHDRTDLGYMAIINGQHQGLLFDKELTSPVRIGDKLDGFIKRIRPDGKVDLSITKPGFNREVVGDLGQKILDQLQAAGGYLPLNDRTDPAEIKKAFGVSKRTFKMALGGLYKQRLIQIEPTGIRIND
ncbi:CvfB family protein [Endozoicomonas numazuensis]|uniref:GntR family transcriptional regulator n=1 Tax=Endozoicomonas numazuensis TaxID=1137799 RepID=A0A081NJG8_9GAMM|nr:S1-like domain-containing RNA-binding protein [Endozoicomonas numazuensis]KEQ18591.1 GntR family transcriptional regulator [Endozoicomonas numazuensis]